MEICVTVTQSLYTAMGFCTVTVPQSLSQEHCSFVSVLLPLSQGYNSRVTAILRLSTVVSPTVVAFLSLSHSRCLKSLCPTDTLLVGSHLHTDPLAHCPTDTLLVGSHLHTVPLEHCPTFTLLMRSKLHFRYLVRRVGCFTLSHL